MSIWANGPGGIRNQAGIIATLLLGTRDATALNNDGKIPVLLYHSWTVADHDALARDLATIDAQAYRIIPAFWAVQWALSQRDGSTLPAKSVALTFDDGARGDWYDEGGTRSFRRILEEFKATHPHQTTVHASSFVIGSPTARQWIDLDGGLSDSWWAEATGSGLIEIYNHGADHDHPAIGDAHRDGQPDGFPPYHPWLWDGALGIHVALSAGPGGGQGSGDFARINDYREADGEVRRSAAYIATKIAPAWPDLFAYPYGKFSTYLATRYFPHRQAEHKTIAAFRTGTGVFASNYLKRTTNRWQIPRFTCGAPQPNGWTDTAGLVEILTP